MDDPNLYLRGNIAVYEGVKRVHITRPCLLLTVYSELMEYLEEHMSCDVMITALDEKTFEMTMGWTLFGAEKLTDPSIGYLPPEYGDDWSKATWFTNKTKAEPNGNV